MFWLVVVVIHEILNPRKKDSQDFLKKILAFVCS